MHGHHTLRNVTVTVSTQELLNRVTENRAVHEATYHKALKGWKEQVQDQLSRYIEIFNANDDPRMLRTPDFSRLRKPVHHLESYDSALEMIRWQQSDTITLDKGQFDALVRDKWDWSEGFTISSESYGA